MRFIYFLYSGSFQSPDLDLISCNCDFPWKPVLEIMANTGNVASWKRWHRTIPRSLYGGSIVLYAVGHRKTYWTFEYFTKPNQSNSISYVILSIQSLGQILFPRCTNLVHPEVIAASTSATRAWNCRNFILGLNHWSIFIFFWDFCFFFVCKV